MQRGKDCKPGDKVRFLHEKGEGIVTKVTSQYVYVDIGDGFELPMLYNDVIIIEKAKIQTETTLPQEQVNNIKPNRESSVRQLSKRNQAKLNKGVYLAFTPEKQDFILSGDLLIYLINYTAYDLMYVIFSTNVDAEKPIYKGEIESASAILLETIKRSDVSKFSKLISQFVICNCSEKGILAPITANIEIKTAKFSNEEFYYENPILDKKALTTQIFRIEELSYISQFSTNKSYDEVVSIKSEIIQKKSFIDKYEVANKEAEVDLHLEKIVDDVSKVENFRKLQVQLEYMKKCLDSAIESSYRKIVFIHGVGVGVLKIELHKILSTYENIEFRDAPIAQYGIGATEVLIHKKI